MPRRVKGRDLDAMERATVLAGHPYRWTVENEPKARPLFDPHGGPPTEEPQDSDEEWLANHAFWFNSDGRLTKGKEAEWIGEHYIGSQRREGEGA